MSPLGVVVEVDVLSVPAVESLVPTAVDASFVLEVVPLALEEESPDVDADDDVVEDGSVVLLLPVVSTVELEEVAPALKRSCLN